MAAHWRIGIFHRMPELGRRPYREAAPFYRARPPYSVELRKALSAKLGWDGCGRLLDIGCGPGVVALDLEPSFAQVLGLDPEENMLAEAVAATAASAQLKTRWVQGRAEDIPTLGLGQFQAVTLAQSFHWTDKEAVAEIVYDSLEPGGSMLLIHHETPWPYLPERFPNTAHSAPPIPYSMIDEILSGYLGRGKPPLQSHLEPYGELLARTRLGPPKRLLLPGRSDLNRTVDDVIDGYLSTSFAAPDLFGDRLTEFRGELVARLHQQTLTGLFWEWPGDTEVLIATKLV
jgi:SAM-dependent methyltransferase